jgi:hypothetical protein
MGEPQLRTVGPVTGGAHGWPFGSALVDLAALGYVEEEYFLSGEAERYRLAGTEYSYDGRWTVESAGRAPFQTRVLVRRPSDPSRFNGTVLVGWNNVSSGFEGVGGEADELFHGGFAFAGASVQRVGVHGLPFGNPLGLAAWDPPRYGDLSIPSDDYSYDIFSLAARAVGPGRPIGPGDPLAGLDVERLVAWGRSQSAIRLATYYNAFQPLTQLFAGFLLEVYHGGGAMVSSLSPGGPVPEIPEPMVDVVNLLPYGSHLLRDDLAQPVLVVNSETEALPGANVRQPDSPAYRLWEVAGAAHVGRDARLRSEARQRRDFGNVVPEPWSSPDDANTLSMDAVYDAALHHLQSWITGGGPPASVPPIEVSGSPPAIVRDEHGNARGGLRLPDLEAPVATHIGASPPGTTPNLFGHSTPFPPDVLARLYPDEDAYRAKRASAVEAAVAAGFVLARDAERLLAAPRR